MKAILFLIMVIIVSCSVTIPPTYIYYNGNKPQYVIDSVARAHSVSIPQYTKWIYTSYYGVHNHDSLMFKNYIYNIKTKNKQFIIINVIENAKYSEKSLNIRIE